MAHCRMSRLGIACGERVDNRLMLADRLVAMAGLRQGQVAAAVHLRFRLIHDAPEPTQTVDLGNGSVEVIVAGNRLSKVAAL